MALGLMERSLMTGRQERIQILSRMNSGRAAAPSFLASLSEALGEPIGASALVPLLESDVLLEAFRNGYRLAVNGGLLSYRKFFRASESQLVFELADCLAVRMLGERVFLFAKPSTNCGAVTLDVSMLLRHTGSLIRFDGDSLSAISLDQTQGLLVDHNPGDPEQTYETAVWGDRWSLLALACGRNELT
jgi:hypothetical protein